MSLTVNVSAWSIRHRLGPIVLTVRNHAGKLEQHRVTEGQTDIALPDLPHHIKEAFGAEGLEIPDWYLTQASKAELDAFAAAIRAEDMTLVNVTLDTRAIGAADPHNRSEDVAEAKRMIDLAARCGARAARINVFPPPIVPEGPCATFPEVVAALTDLVAYSEAKGIRLMMENHCDLTDTPEKVRRLLAAVSGLGLILDTGNIGPISKAVVDGFMSGKAARRVEDISAVLAFLRELLPIASLVHVKTYGIGADGEPLVYDQQQVMDLVLDSGYDGPISIECASFDPPQVYPGIAWTVERLNAALGRPAVEATS